MTTKPRHMAGASSDLLSGGVGANGTGTDALVHDTLESLWDVRTCLNMARDWAETIWGEREGWGCALFAFDGHVENGKYKHGEITPRFYRWPDACDEFANNCLAMADQGDVYAGVLLRERPSRRQSESLALPGYWAWMDADDWDSARQTELESFDTQIITVMSGGKPEKRHLYVDLGREYAGRHVAAISAKLAARLGTDTYGGDKKLLRVPGTYNNKPAAEGGERARVTAPCGQRVHVTVSGPRGER